MAYRGSGTFSRCPVVVRTVVSMSKDVHWVADFIGWQTLGGRCGSVFFFPRFVESLRTLVTMFRSFTGVVFWLTVVVLGFVGVDVIVGGKFSGSESDSSGTVEVACFLETGAINFSISSWFSAEIVVRSDRISFPRVDFISSKFSAWTFGDLLVPAMGFSFRSFPFRRVSWSIEPCCTSAFFFWLLLVILEREKERS